MMVIFAGGVLVFFVAQILINRAQIKINKNQIQINETVLAALKERQQ